ncbi:hypothetical protein O1611_g4832 [Lasiodiplodia mahajangana]|uniref:Uncharacterized protein n=1 Tax=Lasiodiplodia mahajangana TaxID=1108764 RepID=A0ACC2JN75_9PEZI|nr:hypothetical protein O1611_g4832 [Lasiodiplodia mahajangana]
MSSNSELRPAQIKVDLPVYGDICSILVPDIKDGHATEWHVVWSSNKTLCDQYEAAQYDVCEIRTELAQLYGSTFPDCSATKWTAPAIIDIPAASTTDYYPRPSPSTHATPDINVEPWWWPIMLAFIVIVCFFCASLCYAFCFGKGDEQAQEENVASECPPPAYQAKTDVETGNVEKGR